MLPERIGSVVPENIRDFGIISSIHLKKQKIGTLNRNPKKSFKKNPNPALTNFPSNQTPIQMRATLPDLTGLTNSTSLTNLYSCTI